jgi:hypothetical protein
MGTLLVTSSTGLIDGNAGDRAGAVTSNDTCGVEPDARTAGSTCGDRHDCPAVILNALEVRKESQCAIMLFDHVIGRLKNSDPIAAIVLKGFPPDVGFNSNFTELVSQAACHQLVYAIEALQKIEMDCQGVLKLRTRN